MTVFPLYGWIGLAIMTASEILMLSKVEPFWSWHTPIAWTGYIFFADALVRQRRGDSLLTTAPLEAAFVGAAGIPLWVIFEAYNKYSLHNWYYIGLPENLAVRYFGYAWAFATISIAIFETAECVGAFRGARRDVESSGAPPVIPLGLGGTISVLAGAFMLLLPIVHPSDWLAAPVWLGFIFLLDPLNAAAGDESIRGDLREGHSGRLKNLLAAGVICGFIWEFWNYWAGSKWIYTVPVPPRVKIFEMPVAGFFGFPPFAVECFTMYVFVRHLLWRRRRRAVAL
ncbi:MAG TPA: hypothetical protein VNR64_08145 [Vicinamibacterales bacterium]|nr:hypothetical protein [Vicinamibacterales bacterium]